MHEGYITRDAKKWEHSRAIIYYGMAPYWKGVMPPMEKFMPLSTDEKILEARASALQGAYEEYKASLNNN